MFFALVALAGFASAQYSVITTEKYANEGCKPSTASGYAADVYTTNGGTAARQVKVQNLHILAQSQTLVSVPAPPKGAVPAGYMTKPGAKPGTVVGKVFCHWSSSQSSAWVGRPVLYKDPSYKAPAPQAGAQQPAVKAEPAPSSILVNQSQTATVNQTGTATATTNGDQSVTCNNVTFNISVAGDFSGTMQGLCGNVQIATATTNQVSTINMEETGVTLGGPSQTSTLNTAANGVCEEVVATHLIGGNSYTITTGPNGGLLEMDAEVNGWATWGDNDGSTGTLTYLPPNSTYTLATTKDWNGTFYNGCRQDEAGKVADLMKRMQGFRSVRLNLPGQHAVQVF